MPKRDRARARHRAPLGFGLPAALVLLLGILATPGVPGAGRSEADRCDPHPEPGTLGTLCGFDHPEDLERVDAAGLVVASGLRPGAGLWALAVAELGEADVRPWRLWPAERERPPSGPPASPASLGAPGDAGCTQPPEADQVHFHGLSSRPLATGGTLLAAVNHGGREAVELFEIRGTGRAVRATWVGCILVPAGRMANDVALARGGEVFVTHFVDRSTGWRYRWHTLKTVVGLPTGAVLVWTREDGWSVVRDGLSGPNGVVTTPDASRLYVGESGRRRILALSPGDPEAEAKAHPVGASVDNLSWGRGGRVLGVLHTGGIEALFQDCLQAWAVVAIDPSTDEVSTLLRHDGPRLCGATSVVPVGPRYLIGSMNGTRVGVWRPPTAARP